LNLLRLTCIPALLKCRYRIFAQKPLPRTIKSRLYPESLITLGDYMRKTRLDLNLTQEQVANDILKTSFQNVSSWEDNRHSVSLWFRPKIIEFIGFCPYDTSLPIGLKLRERRENFGLTVKELACLLKVNPCTITSWEQCEHNPSQKSLKIIDGFLKAISIDKILDRTFVLYL
jgi:transcriptional regulator with XRE-family HTH domain